LGNEKPILEDFMKKFAIIVALAIVGSFVFAETAAATTKAARLLLTQSPPRPLQSPPLRLLQRKPLQSRFRSAELFPALSLPMQQKRLLLSSSFLMLTESH